MAVSNKYFCFFNYCSVTVVPPFSPLLTPTLLPQFPHQSPLIFHAHESSIHVPWLAPSPSFPFYLPPVSLLVTVSLFFIFKSLVLFCSIVFFVDWVPLIGEIIQYLSFTVWLISLSIMLSILK